jgi:hypothetical protein
MKKNKNIIKKPTLFEIESFYENLGYRGEKLRKVLKKDKEYQRLLRERKQKLIKTFKITPVEKKRYVLSTDRDFEILGKCKELEKKKLAKRDRKLVECIKTQLTLDWRTPLLKVLNELLKKYKRK